jgi:hypothetical protein
MSNTVHSVPPIPAEKGQDGDLQAKPTWTAEALMALAEETSNHGAHIPEYGAVEKWWKDVLEAKLAVNLVIPTLLIFVSQISMLD